MKKILLYTFLPALLLISACNNKSDSEQAKADYQQSLNDSIAALQSQIDSCNSQISILNDQVNDWLRDFTTVSNPREAASYIIMTSAQKDYPMKSTGVIARLNDMGQFELIAALSSKPFDSIELNSGSMTVESDVVPKDQALNYQTSALTTVTFSGEKADAVGQFIADNQLNPVSITYLNGGKPVYSLKLGNEQTKVISDTYLLYKSNSELQRLERRVPMLHEKINLIRLHLDKVKPEK